jgi:hypothetical protein
VTRLEKFLEFEIYYLQQEFNFDNKYSYTLFYTKLIIFDLNITEEQNIIICVGIF